MYFINVIYSWASLIQYSVSHDPSEIIHMLLKKHLLLSMLKTV